MSTKKTYTVVTKTPTFLAKTTKAKSVTLAKDKDSKRYKTIGLIPKSIIEFCESSG